MKNPFGFGLAIAATASLAIAGGGGEDKDKEKSKKSESNTKKLEQMGGGQEEKPATQLAAAPGEGFTVTVGDDFSLNVKNRIQVLYTYSSIDEDLRAAAGIEDSSNFTVRRARTKLSGHVWDESMTYNLQVDWVGGGTLLDAWFRWRFWEENDNSIALRLGQQKPHFGREFQGTSENLELIDRSVASRTFSGNRVIGAWLQGKHLEDGKLHWNVGVANGDAAAGTAGTAFESGNGAANSDQRMNYYFDARFDPMGDFGDESYMQGDLAYHEDLKGTIGASLMLGNERVAPTPGTQNIETTAWNFYTGWKYQGLHAMGEVFLREDDPDAAGASDSDSTGWALQGSYTLQPQEEGASQWGFAGRFSQVRNEDNQNLLVTPFPGSGTPVAVPPLGVLGAIAGRVTEIEGTIDHYYHEHKMKAQLGYRYQRLTADSVPDTETENHFIEINFQWVF